MSNSYYSAKSVSEFLTQVAGLRDLFGFRRDDPWGPWFRGQKLAQWGLQPRLYREYGGYLTVREKKIEDEIREEFIVRAPVLCEHLPVGDESREEWEWYFMMHHFGTPTRLLDWTDGSLIALYFAVKDNEGLYDAAVWALDPYSLNEEAINKSIMGPGWVIPPSAPGVSKAVRKEVNRWMPRRYSHLRGLPRKAIAVYPSHTQRRISTQRSCFTIHGTDPRALDRLCYEASRFMAKIVIPAWSVQRIRRELDGAGIDEATIFPDLGGLSRAIGARWTPDGHDYPHKNVCTRLHPSKIHGIGVFAIVHIKKGTQLFTGENQEMPWFEKRSIPLHPKEIRNLYDDFAIVDDNCGRYGCPQSFNRLTPSWYLNEPSDGQRANVVCDTETYEFAAARDIRPGEELTVTYATYSDSPRKTQLGIPARVFRDGKSK